MLVVRHGVRPVQRQDTRSRVVDRGDAGGAGVRGERFERALGRDDPHLEPGKVCAVDVRDRGGGGDEHRQTALGERRRAAHGNDRRVVDQHDCNVDGLAVALGTPCARRAEVVARDRDGRRAGEVQSRREAHSVQRRVDGGLGAREGHAHVGGAVTPGEAQASGARERERSVGRSERDLQRANAGIRVADRDRVAVAGREDARGILGCDLRTGNEDRRRVVVDVGHRHVDGGGGGAAVAIADGVRERVGAGEVRVRGVGDRSAAPDDGDRAVGALRDAGDGQGLADVRGGRIVQERIDRVRAGILGDARGVVVGRRGVVDRIDGHVHGRGGATAVAVVDRVGKRIHAGEIGVRGVGDSGAADDRNRPVGSLGDGRDGERLAGVGNGRVVEEHVDQVRTGVLRHNRVVVDRGWRVVGRGDADRDRADVGAALAVGHGVVEAHRAGEIEVRGEGEGAPGVQRDRAGGDRHRVADRDRDAVDLGDAQRVAVEVGVAGEHVDVGEGRVLGGGQAQLVVGHRRVVGRGDADRDRADVGAALAVGHGVVEAHRAGEIEVRGEGEGAPGVQRDRAGGDRHRVADRDRDAVDLGDAQRVAVEVGVAGEHVDVGEGRVLGGGQAQLVVGHRRVVGRGDADRDRADVGAALAVGHGVVEAHRAGEIEVRGEGEGAPGVQRDRAGGDRHRVADRDRDAVDLGDAQRVAVEVGVAGEHVDVGEGRVLGGGQAQLVVGHRRVVGRGDADRDRADVGAALAVGHGVVEAHRAGEIEVRGEGEGAPGVQRDRAGGDRHRACRP